MSNIEKIRQEIERRRDIAAGIFEENSDTYYQGKAVAYHGLLSFIDSLPEEFPPYCTGAMGEPDDPGTSDLEELEKAAEERARKIYPYEGGTKGLICETSIPIFKAGFIAGAEWQKDQMMKKAVEGEVVELVPERNYVKVERDAIARATSIFKEAVTRLK